MVEVYLQDACLRHQYIRSKDLSNIVERPERLRAVNVGIATVMARTSTPEEPLTTDPNTKQEPDANDLASAIGRLNIDNDNAVSGSSAIQIHKSAAKVNILNNAAVKYVHGDTEGDVYLEKLIKLAKDSKEKIAAGDSEIPEGLSQGDLYLCPESVDAIQGALGSACEAVDQVLDPSSTSTRAFVAIRPPGHHCGEDTPSGFCFVNNVAVAAAHAHLKHGVTRVVIFDIDLHHGNGTQSIVWQINEETYRVKLEESHGAPPQKPGLQVFYGSLHDILSYPCEDGKVDLVQAASVSIHGPHGQYIENIHLEPYTSETQFFDELYAKKYSKLLTKASDFIAATGGPKDDVLVFISCGFDACEHEYESMSRHGRKVPVSFYHRFAQDTRAFADRVAGGRLISVLEGGYSDRALTSGVIAHLAGLAESERVQADPEWWALENLVALEKATKKRRGGRPSLTKPAPWLERTLECFAQLDAPVPPAAPPLSMALRDRSKAPSEPAKKSAAKKPREKAAKEELSGSASEAEGVSGKPVDAGTKKLPRVILKLGPQPDKDPEGAS